ncbi:MAG: carbohydrate kinase family protein [Fervidicoccaceae archaeon]
MKVAVIGHALVDHEYVVDRIAETDDEYRIIENFSSPGGSALNTSVGLKELGNLPVLIANVGRDRRGLFLRSFIKKRNLEMSGLRIREGRTGFCIVIRDTFGGVRIFSKLGVSEPIYFDEKMEKALRGVEGIHIASLSIGNIGELLNFLTAIDLGERITWDIGRVVSKSPEESIVEIAKRMSVIFISEREAMNIAPEFSPRDTASRLSSYIEGLLVLKKSDGGEVYRGGRKIAAIKLKKKFQAIDTLGAGDAFASSFLTSYFSGESAEDSLGKAIIYAGLKVGRKGGSNMPSAKELYEEWADRSERYLEHEDS